MKRLLAGLILALGLVVVPQTPTVSAPMPLIIAQAQAANIDPALEYTFGHEGGFQKMRGDAGNWTGGKIGVGKLVGTKFGIAAASYPKEDIVNLKIERAAFIYKNDFWGASRCDDWKNQTVAELYFDLAVNLGQGTAARRIQQAVNLASWPQAPIAVDGVIGKGTVKRLNESNQVDIYCYLVILGGERYLRIVERNPNMMQHFRGWVALRLRKNVQRGVHVYEANRR